MPELYAFMGDVALTNRVGVIERVKSSDTDVGYFDTLMGTYYSNPAMVRDPRTTRLQIDGRVAMLGMALHFDYTSDTVPFPFGSLSSADLIRLFNLIEYAALKQGATAEEIHEAFLADSGAYGIYSGAEGDTQVEVASVVVASTITTSAGSTVSGLNIRSWVSINVTIGSTVYTVKVWYGRDAFLDSYPLGSITAVTCPIGIEYLVDPDSLSTIMGALDASSAWTANVVDTEVTNRNHTGTVPYEVSYYSGTPTPVVVGDLTFNIFYKGRLPTDTEVISAIKTALETEGAAQDPVIGTDTWESIFPTLYTTGEFYLFPMWDNTFDDDGTPRISGISQYSALLTEVASILTNQSSANLIARSQLVMTTATQALLIAVPGPNNTVDTLSLKGEDMFPDYQSSAFSGMATATSEFRTALYNAIAVAAGTESGDIVTKTFSTEGETYYFASFSLYDIQYYVLCAEGVTG